MKKEKEKFKKKREKNHYSQTKKNLTQFVNWFRNFIDNAE